MTASVSAPRTTRGKLATSVNQEQLAEITELFRNRRKGYSLEAPLYTDPSVFDVEMQAIFGTHWLFAASIAEIPEPGDYVTVDYGPHSLIVLRTEEGGVNVLHNVCRHRGARVLTEASGSTGNLVCGYHSWTYSPEGDLIHASAPGEGKFDKSCFALKRAHGRVHAGLVFVSLAQDPPADFDEVAGIFEPYLAPHDIARAKVAYQQDIIEEGNWKLVMENNRECYHCDGHPELACSLFPTWGLSDDTVPPHLEEVWERNQQAQAALEERCRRYGLPYEVVEQLDTRIAGIRISRESLDGDGESFSADGHRLSKKLLGELRDFRLGRCSMHLQPNSWFHFQSDHVITFAAFPINEHQTLVRTTWLVADDAVEGDDYDLEKLTHTWKQTNLQDKAFVELCQKGAASPAYQPGPYMKSEYQVEAFINWYTQRVLEHLA
ncbi:MULTISPECIES: SRPBCC family protein [Micrococcales]|uniref:aromatic ring-hydroxylating oxygenase subunit alpha n=1 Tax=Micrococcales TaxID=85006 RepID=UPI000CFBFA3B|nr:MULTISPECIES: aromatic ring-hydroxylating dioxygenase subunit alpha [unclassified Arthrobacter]MCS3494676.1 Rieske 2Fe-2S family protein [Arthrobacter sp. JUb119]PQZ84875.1 (Fe-S)-binding protein [Arthrobacter sp. MYb222]TDU27335.1 Rieske 2Fe-2S family protein [Arthrobacter sp. JUb115]